jgi:hypothetical protein
LFTPEDDMIALSLWLTCAALAGPPSVPAQAASTAPEQVPDAAAAPAADGDDLVVAKDEPGPAEPAPPFVLTGFLPADQLAVGALLGAGSTSKSNDASVDIHLRYHGVLAGVIVGGSDWRSNSDDISWTRTMGVEAGYGWAPSRLRLEAALGYGKSTERREPPGGGIQSSGQFLRARLAGDWAVLGGEGWRVAVGAGLYWRRIQGLSWSPAEHQEFGLGLRISGELGW